MQLGCRMIGIRTLLVLIADTKQKEALKHFLAPYQ